MKKNVIISFFVLVAGIIFCARGVLAENVFLEEKIIPSEVKEFSVEGNYSRGIFELDGRRISVEIRRGPMIYWAMRLWDPAAPLFEIDIYLSDENGVPFFVQFGGHGPINDNWASEDFFRQAFMDNQELFSMARKIVVFFQREQFRNGWLPEQNALKNILPLLEAEEKRAVAENYASAVSSSDQHYIEIWKKSAFFTGNIFGDHSATLVKAISKTKTYQIWSACNHGSCPGSGMSKACSKTFSNRAGFCSSPPMCSTNYGFVKGQHVCNDDSYIQYKRIKDNSNPNTSGGTCSDSSLRISAPSCD